MTDKKRKVKYEGELDLNGLKLPCYVLEDGTRVFIWECDAKCPQNG